VNGFAGSLQKPAIILPSWRFPHFHRFPQGLLLLEIDLSLIAVVVVGACGKAVEKSGYPLRVRGIGCGKLRRKAAEKLWKSLWKTRCGCGKTSGLN
jgi:hypothetical protein